MSILMSLVLWLISLPILAAYGAWTTPRTWVPGELVTASQMNTHLRDNLNILKTCLADDGAFEGYKETKQTVAIASGVLTINYDLGNHVVIALNANITSIVITNWPTSHAGMLALHFTADGTPRTIAWATNTVNGNAATIAWGTPGAPTMTSTNAKIDVVTFYSPVATKLLGTYNQNY